MHDHYAYVDDNDAIIVSIMMNLATCACLLVLLLDPMPRNPSLFEQRLKWDAFQQRHGHRRDFKRHIRLPSVDAFNKLLGWIKHDLLVNEQMVSLRGGAILPELQLYCALRWLAGGSYSDIKYMTGISTASFYFVVWKVIRAINSCPELDLVFPQSDEECKEASRGFESISDHGAIWRCVSVVDGYFLHTRTPPKRLVPNVRSFFSGHYQQTGVNVQAAADHHCRFQFVGVAGPGVMGDRTAIHEVELGGLIERLPGMFFAIGDCAYTPTEHLVPIFGGEQAKIGKHDRFNFYASQLRIRIEMAFGLMVKKWGILQRPMICGLHNVKHVICCIARLHNFVINERLVGKAQSVVHTPRDVAFDSHTEALRDLATHIEFNDMVEKCEAAWSKNRDLVVGEIVALQINRPGTTNIRKRKNEQ